MAYPVSHLKTVKQNMPALYSPLTSKFKKREKNLAGLNRLKGIPNGTKGQLKNRKLPS